MIFTGALLTLLLIYGWSSILYAYVYSYFKKTLVSSMLLFIAVNFILGIYFIYLFLSIAVIIYYIIDNFVVNFFTGMFISTGLYILKDIIRERNTTSSFNTLNIIRLIVLIIPHFSYSSCISGFLQITWENNMCKVCKSPVMIEICKSKYLYIHFFFFCGNCHYF